MLYLIPNFLAENPDRSPISPEVSKVVRTLSHFIIENPKPANKLLKSCGVPTPFEGINFYPFNKHTSRQALEEIIIMLTSGVNMGLITDAGYPAIADPGERIVRMAHINKVKVIPLSGSSSVLLALAASGLNAEKFTFHSYLPIQKEKRIFALENIEKEILQTNYSQIFIETPYRNMHVFNDIIDICDKKLLLCIATDITGTTESIMTKTIAIWKKEIVDLNKRQVIFLLGK
jgi:16S rRNA (cytidine1402-2'-O)-methyltransferase